MACEVKILPSAIKDVDSVLEYLTMLNPQAAKSFLAEWNRVLESLREGVVEYRLSRFEPLAKRGYRTILMKSYVVIYRMDGDVATVAHLFHQSQDYARFF